MNDDDNEDQEADEVPQVPCDCDACRAERGETEPRPHNNIMAELIAFNPSGKENGHAKTPTRLLGCNEGRRSMLCEVLAEMPNAHLRELIGKINAKNPLAFMQDQTPAFYFLMCDLAVESLVSAAERQQERQAFAQMMQDT